MKMQLVSDYPLVFSLQVKVEPRVQVLLLQGDAQRVSGSPKPKKSDDYHQQLVPVYKIQIGSHLW